MIVIRASPTDDSDIVSNGSTTKKTTKVQPVSEPGQCDESMPKNTGLSWVGPFFNVNPWKGKDHEVKFFGLFHGLRSERIINYDDALQDAENNEFYFDTEGNLHPDMVNKLRRIAKNHKIYLIVHGWTDSIESLHRIYGVGMYNYLTTILTNRFRNFSISNIINSIYIFIRMADSNCSRLAILWPWACLYR